MRIDNMTLAVFEDSGWYRVNYAHADSFFWGRGTRANTLKLSPLAIWDSRNLSFRRFIIRAKSANDTLLTVINGSENAFDFNCGISGRVFLTFFWPVTARDLESGMLVYHCVCGGGDVGTHLIKSVGCRHTH